MWNAARGPAARGVAMSITRDRPTAAAWKRRDATRSGVLRVLFWNRHHFSGAARTFDYLDSLRTGWDVALLIECGKTITDAARERYGDGNVASVFDHHDGDDVAKPHGPLVVVRNGVSVLESQLTIPHGDGIENPKPDKSLTVELATPWGALTVLATHVMPGAESWTRKLATYRELVDALSPASQQWPVVMGIDGNNGGDWLEPNDAGNPPADDGYDQWVFHAPDPPHGLTDTLRQAIGNHPERYEAAQRRLADMDVLVGTRPRRYDIDRMDRIYASPDLHVVDAGVDAASMEFSDHALVWAELMFEPTPVTSDPGMVPTRLGTPSTASSKKRESAETIAEAVSAVLEGYGWNRRGYVARVALGVISNDNGCAPQGFIDDHYRGVAQPSRRWSLTRVLCNKSWRAVGGAPFSEEFIVFNRESGTHSMDPQIASAVLEALGIENLLEDIEAADLEQRLAERIDPHRSDD